MLKLTAAARQAGKLELLLVSSEPAEEVQHMLGTARSLGIDCPLLRSEAGPDAIYKQWNVHGNPIAFLIDPQGVIVAKGRGYETHDLGELALWQIEHGATVANVRCRTAVLDRRDGNVDLRLELSSPSRLPLCVEVDYVLYKLTFDATGKITDVQRIKPVEAGPEHVQVVDCGEWGEVVRMVSIDLTGYQGVQYDVRILLPGTEVARGGTGFWTHQRGWYYINGDNVNGEKN